MKVEFFCPIWGLVPDYIERINAPLAPVLERIKRAGYDGIEMAVPLDKKQQQFLVKLLEDCDLKLIALQWAASATEVDAHLVLFEQHVRSAASACPLIINCHTGKDYYRFDDNCRFIDLASKLSDELAIPVIHETHRSRFNFHAQYSQPYLQKYPDLKLAADFSHWCNVSESLLDDQPANLANAVKHAVHIHARVGHQQGCQVSDPQAPEFSEALASHLNWWDAIYNHRKATGAEVLTITPEFGPVPYMPAHPYSKLPVADHWENNCWMKDMLKKRYRDKPNRSRLVV